MPTVQSAKRGQRTTVRREKRKSNRETLRQRLPIDNAIRRETEGRGGGGLLHPSRQQRPSEEGRGGLPTMISHGVEISIAGGVGKKVRANYTVPGGSLIYLIPTRNLALCDSYFTSHDS